MSMDVLDLGGRPVIVGGGIAGLMTALHLAPEPVLLLSRSPLGADASSTWAQGGLAASLGEDDEPALHLSDTLAAGDGLCDAQAARRIVYAAAAAIEDLARLGVRFDRTPAGALRLGLEAAHGRRRIVHADGDGSGREIMRALVADVRSTPTIAVIEGIAGGVRAAIERARSSVGHLVKIEVEVDTLAQLEEVLALAPDVVLLDNMSIDELRQAVAMVAGRAITEASGRVTPATAPAVAATGVDLISIGWLTHSAPILDIGLDYSEF
ncbi:FAD-dependent oxidoreductase [Mesorhizobium sp. M1329]|uniref:FAD-dependent oxidoreductase n=1 Tax=Mesorhizobium sp. M1329 TaxID=2957083 RepID=UPI00333D1958